MPVTRSATRLNDFYPATKRPRSPSRSKDGKSASPKIECDKKENTPTKKIRQEEQEYQGRTPEQVIRAKRCLGLGQNMYKVVGRDAEVTQLKNFIQSKLEDGNAASMYVSGLPGTGKTMCVKKVIDDLKGALKFRLIFINCMGLESTSALFSRIGDSLELKRKTAPKRTPSKVTIKDLEAFFTAGGIMNVLCLDEIDQLHEKCGSTLSRVFEWPALTGSNVVLIGIANSFDLTERCLKKLSLKGDAKPQLLHFRPYQTEEVIAIVKDRLSEYTDIMHPQAMELCARKCAALAGDVRKALETCKIAVERAASKKTESTSSAAPSTESYCSSSEVLAALQDVYAPSKKSSQYITLPMQQKMIFAAALALASSGFKQFAVEKLYDQYKRLCTATHVPAVDSSEVRNLCDLLESNGLIRRSIQSNKYILNVSEKNAREVINDDRLLSTLLADKM